MANTQASLWQCREVKWLRSCVQLRVGSVYKASVPTYQLWTAQTQGWLTVKSVWVRFTAAPLFVLAHTPLIHPQYVLAIFDSFWQCCIKNCITKEAGSGEQTTNTCICTCTSTWTCTYEYRWASLSVVNWFQKKPHYQKPHCQKFGHRRAFCYPHPLLFHFLLQKLAFFMWKRQIMAIQWWFQIWIAGLEFGWWLFKEKEAQTIVFA